MKIGETKIGERVIGGIRSEEARELSLCWETSSFILFKPNIISKIRTRKPELEKTNLGKLLELI